MLSLAERTKDLMFDDLADRAEAAEVIRQVENLEKSHAELLAACEQARDHLEWLAIGDTRSPEQWTEIQEALEDAIAKATGPAPEQE